MSKTINYSQKTFRERQDVNSRQDLLASLRVKSLERDDTGKYRVYKDKEGNEYFSVTTILSNTEPEAKRKALEAWQSKPGNAESLQVACDRGTYVHEQCERTLKIASKINANICNARNCWKIYEDGLFRGPKAILQKSIQTANERKSKIPWAIRKYEENVANWINTNVAAIHASEFSIHSKDGMFAGQADALIDYKKSGNLCLIDFKTSGSTKPKPDAWLDNYRLQLSAYAWGLFERTGISVPSAMIVIARENGLQEVPMNLLELAGGKSLFQDRIRQFHSNI